MEVTEQIKVFQEFLEIHYLAELMEAVRIGQTSFQVDFATLSKHSPELADLLLEQPDEVVKACELSLSNFDLPKEIKNFHIRFKNLPDQHKMFVRNIRSEHINKLLVVEGTIRQKSDVRPQVTSARFECPSCGNVMNVLQLDSKFKEPSRCGCGRKGKFRLLSKELIDVQGIVLEEATKDLEGGAQPKRMNILLKQDLVSPMSDKKTNPGTTLQIVGVLKEIPIILRSGGQSTKYDLLIEANNIIPLEEDYSNIQIKPEEEEAIKKLSEDPKISQKLAIALAPGIYGHQKIKEALILQFVGGVKKLRDDGVMSRGDIHILLIGDPGAGKTIHGNSKIVLSDGTYCTIKEFVESSFRGIEEYMNFSGSCVPSLTGLALETTNPITGLWKRKAEKLYKVKTKTGKELICTATNPFFTAASGHVKVTKTKNLSLHDWIALPRKISVDCKEQTLLVVGKSISVTPAVGRFFAYVLAESYACYAPEKSRYVIEFINTDAALVSDFASLSEKLFGQKTKEYGKNNIKKLYFMNKEILRDFYAIEPSLFTNSFNKKIPQFIMRSPLLVISSFLATFFECDGYVEKGHGVGMTLASKEMVDQIQHLLLRFGIVSHCCSVTKYATNTSAKIKRTYWKLSIYGTHARTFLKEIGFLSARKNTSLKKINDQEENTNIDVIPQLSSILKDVRTKLRMTQSQMNIPRSTYQHFEKGDRNPSRAALQKIVAGLQIRVCELLLVLQKADAISLESNREIYHASQQEMSSILGCSQTLVSHYEANKIQQDEAFDYTSLKQKIFTLLDDEVLLRQLNNLALLSTSNIFWDQIVSIEPYETNDPYIYDLEVAETHNFIANHLYVHNSQLLKRAAVVAPKARFVSGKGVSGAGLCVSPNSLLLTNPGGIETIEKVIEPRLDNPNRIQQDVWKQEDVNTVKIQSLTKELKIQSQIPEALWKLKAPDIIYEITLASGKKIEITGNTQLLTLHNGALLWKKSMEFQEKEYIATPRTLIGGNVKQQETVDFIEANPVVHNVKDFVAMLTLKLKEKYGNLRLASKKLQVAENNLYFHWVNKKARGNIKLRELKRIAEDVQIPWKQEVKNISLYNGKRHTLPLFLDQDFFYVSGLIAGDGDIRKSGKTYSIRFSNSVASLHTLFTDVLQQQFALHFDVQKGNSLRPTATRTHSKILAQILFSLGIPESPKSHTLSFSSVLLHLTNDFLCHYIAGLYDTDGSVSIRKTKGSNCIDFTTCSEMLARQLQLVLLRFNIHATIRKRKPSIGKIRGKYDKWIIEIRGSKEIQTFAQQIPLRHPEKKRKLTLLTQKQTQTNTNIDIIPTVPEKIRTLLIQKRLSLKKYGWRKSLSRIALQKLLTQLPIITQEEKEVEKIVNADIFWEKIKQIKRKKPNYPYVYDLTVQDAHNFVVDGVLVHNTAAVVKDEFLSGWSLEAGAMVLANKGILMIDEMDKMTDEDRSAMHEGLEQQTISISKANIQATLRCETTVLAAANPKLGRFDPYEPIAKQINMPPALINRFDLIFSIKDLPDKEKDEELAHFILTMHKKHETENVEIETELLRKYLIYARQKVFPRLTDQALEEIKEYYVKMRSSGSSDDKGLKAIPISARQLEALVRLSEACAKVRLSSTITRKDARNAINLLHYCLEQVGLDPETGKIDIDRISTGITTSERAKIVGVREIIGELEEKLNTKQIPIEEIIKAAQEKGLNDEKVNESIEKLKRSGDIFEPRKGFISRLG